MPLTRAKTITVIASTVGATAGALTYMTSHSLPQAMLAAGGAAGGSANLLYQLVHTESRPPAANHEDNLSQGQDGTERENT